MPEFALALDIGTDWHGWCLGDVAERPPRIMAAGIVSHAVALPALGAPDFTSGELPVPIWGNDQAPPSIRWVTPILELAGHGGAKIHAVAQRALQQGGELIGAYYAATGHRPVETHFAEVSRELAGRVLSKAEIHAIAEALYPATGGGKRPHIGTKKEPGPLWALKVQYPNGWAGKRDHHRDAFCALVWWAYRRAPGILEARP